MEPELETPKGKRKLADYVRWIALCAFGLLMLFMMAMAAYRKFGG